MFGNTDAFVLQKFILTHQYLLAVQLGGYAHCNFDLELMRVGNLNTTLFCTSHNRSG